ncbi:MAG: hypothetical protein QM737_00390 [Ferruginibacter sp.]
MKAFVLYSSSLSHYYRATCTTTIIEPGIHIQEIPTLNKFSFVSLTMTAAIIITICILLLIAYIFDLTSSRTRIPSVILLLFLGWIVRQLSKLFDIAIPDLTPLLPGLGTIGLILIVLEGSLELEFDNSKIPLIKKSFIVALVPIIGLGFLLAWMFTHFGGYTFKDSLLNAIPFVVISSAIAIPSVKAQQQEVKEFVIYESSFSDIIGILFFNFIAYNKTISALSFAYFGIDLIIMAVISFVAILGLSLLLSKIDHHIKFAPIVLLLILIYEATKIYNLPALLFILLFGLFLGNLDTLKKFRLIEKLKPDELNVEVHKFKELIIEGTFLVRAVFFLLFGYLMKTTEILNKETILWALSIVAAIFIIRVIMLKLFNIPLRPIMFIAPRGLITILLFLSIIPEKSIPLVNKSLIIQVIIFTAVFMMIGLVLPNKNKQINPGDIHHSTE